MKPVIAACILVLLTPSAPAAGVDKAALQVYLPRDISVDCGTMTLGMVAIVRGSDKALVAKAEAVTLGRSPWPKEHLVLDRPTILSRLAGSSVDVAKVTITGAPRVRVTGKAKVIPPERLRRCADALIKSRPPESNGAVWHIVRSPAEMVLTVVEEPQLQAELARNAPRNHLIVNVVARAGGKEIASATVVYRRGYRVRRAVAAKEICPGQKIMPEHVTIETVTALAPQATDWCPPYGMVSSARIQPGTVIRPGLVRPVGRAVVVRRNQTVLMRIAGPGFTISARGLALQDGRPGDVIRVRNMDSKRIITGRVTPEGLVEPVVEEKTR